MYLLISTRVTSQALGQSHEITLKAMGKMDRFLTATKHKPWSFFFICIIGVFLYQTNAHYPDFIWASRPLKSPDTQLLFHQLVWTNNKDISKLYNTVREIDRWPLFSPYKGPVTWKGSPWHDVIISIATLLWRHNGRDGVSNHQPQFIQAQIKENIKAPRHWPLCREFTGNQWFPAQMASNTENVSIWWHHHEFSCYASPLKPTSDCKISSHFCIFVIQNFLQWFHGDTQIFHFRRTYPASKCDPGNKTRLHINTLWAESFRENKNV